MRNRLIPPSTSSLSQGKCPRKHRRRWLPGLVGIALLLSSGLAYAQARVEGYYRRDGTYVHPYQRTVPDGIPQNNYSFPGNSNPNTGQITGGDPSRYLQRYYESKPLQPSWLVPSQPQPFQHYDRNYFGAPQDAPFQR